MNDPMLLAEIARWFLVVGCVCLALGVIFCVLRDWVRESRVRRETDERLEAVLKVRER